MLRDGERVAAGRGLINHTSTTRRQLSIETAFRDERLQSNQMMSGCKQCWCCISSHLVTSCHVYFRTASQSIRLPHVGLSSFFHDNDQKITHTMADEKTPLEPPPAYDGTGGVAVPASTQQRPAGGPRAPLPLNLPALNMIRGKRVILASASPRRRQLLAQVGLSISRLSHTLSSPIFQDTFEQNLIYTKIHTQPPLLPI